MSRVGLRQFADTVRQARRQADAFFAEVTGVNDPSVRAAGRALARRIRQQLGARGTAASRSAAGEAPRLQTGRLRRSVGQAVVGGVLRVGVARFVGRLLEEGVDSTATAAPAGRPVAPRRRTGGTARRLLRIAPRPFMARALEAALPAMEGEAVSALQSKSRPGGR